MGCFPSRENVKGNICIILPRGAWWTSMQKTHPVFAVFPRNPILTIVLKICIYARICGHVVFCTVYWICPQVRYVHPERFRVIETDWHGLSLRVEGRQRHAVFRIRLIPRILVDNQPVCPINAESLLFIFIVVIANDGVVTTNTISN